MVWLDIRLGRLVRGYVGGLIGTLVHWWVSGLVGGASEDGGN